VSYTIGNTLTDKCLVDKVLGGDAQAFGIIVQQTEGLVAQIVFKMVRNAEDRKDMAQDVYLKAFKSLSGFKFQSKLSTWIGQITYNTCISYLEKKKLVLIDPAEGDDPGDEIQGASSSPIQDNAIDAFMYQKELSAILRTETEKLSPVYKTLITLYHQEDMSYEEIGQITGFPEGTVKSYLFRARKALRDGLLRHYKKEAL